MALTHERISEVAVMAVSVAVQMKQLLRRANELKSANDHLSVGWGNTTKPDWIVEDENTGNLQDFLFTRQQLSNALGSIAEFQTFMGTHLQNLNQIARVDAG